MSTVMADGPFRSFTDFATSRSVCRATARCRQCRRAFPRLGLCGPLARDFTERADYCGLFRTPTLRNVALRRQFLQRRFQTLEQACVSTARGTHPQSSMQGWRRQRDQVRRPPAVYHGNLNATTFDRQAGEAPALSDSEIADIVAFCARSRCRRATSAR